MPRELVLQKWCEVCADEDATVPATVTYSGAIAEQEPEGNMQVRLVDLCERHAKVAADFAEFWSRFAVAPMASQTVPRPGPKPMHGETDPCPECGRQYSAPTTLANHIYSAHLRMPKPMHVTQCPECGEHYENATGLGSHRRSAHHTGVLSDALALLAASNEPPPARRGTAKR